MKRARFHPDALFELQQEINYYSAISPVLALRLVNAVEAAVTRARSIPEIGSPYAHGTRRVFPRKFPFSVVYLEISDEIHVIAVAPFRRRPEYWRERIKATQSTAGKP